MQENEHNIDEPQDDRLPAIQPQHPMALAAARAVVPVSLDLREGDSPTDRDEINLRQYWQIILKHQWTVLIALSIVFFSVLVATLLMTPIYRATATLQIDRDMVKVVQVQGMNTVESLDDTFYKTQYELLKSRALAERVARALNLANDPAYQRLQHPSALSKLLGMFRHDGAASKPKAVSASDMGTLGGFVSSHLSIEPILDSRLVRISFDSPNPQLAARVANAVADNFMASNLERSFNSTAYARQYLESRLQQIKQKLEESEAQLVAVAAKEKIFTGSDGVSLSAQNLSSLNAQLSAVQDQRIRAQARWVQASSATGAALPADMLTNSIVGALRQSRATLMAQYQEKLGIYKPAFPQMQQLKSQIDEIDKQIQAEVSNIKASVRSEYEAAQSQESMLQKQMEILKTQVLDQQSRSIRYTVLKREVDTNRQLYDSLLQRYKEIGVAGGITTNNMNLVDRADVPGGPYKPDLKFNLLLATFFGLVLGVTLALFFEYLDDTLKTPEDIEKQLGLAVLGIIPKLSDITPRKALENPRSAFSEAYRSVRTALQFSTASGVPRTLLVTSSVPNEGKSTTALTLASNFAELGKRVLLIDADLRNPSLHRTLGLDNSSGLSNCLAGAAKPQDVIKSPGLANLDVMTSGPLPPNPAELLAGPKMLALLTVAMAKYDQIIVDGPPTMGIADSPILAHIARGTLLVVDAGQTRREVARGAVKRLTAAHAHLLGALLTKCDTRAGGYGYSGYDYYAYGGDGPPKLTRQ
jgi:succinoglycan biosynthesis transport protein ExoP